MLARRLILPVVAAAGVAAGLPAVAAASDVFYVGDGLGAKTAPFVTKGLSPFTVRADNAAGRDSAAGVAALKSGLKRDDQVVVFDVGASNDPTQAVAFAADLARAGKIADWRCMVVATIGAEGAGPLNKAVRKFASDRLQTRVVDWESGSAKTRGKLFTKAAQGCIDEFAGTGPPVADDPPDPGAGDDSGATPDLDPGADVLDAIDGDAESDVPEASPGTGAKPRRRAGRVADPPTFFGLSTWLAEAEPAGWIRSSVATLMAAVGYGRAAVGPEMDAVLGG